MSDEHPLVTEFESTLDSAQASRLLRLALSGPARPVDELLNRLSQSDAAAWLAGVLTSGPAGTFGPPQTAFGEGGLTPEQLISIKQTGTALAIEAPDVASRLAAMTGYFFAVAAGLTHFGQNITSRDPDQLKPILLDLAAAVPAEWSDLFARAAASLPSSD